MVGVCSALAMGAGSTPLTVVTVRTAETVLLLSAWFRFAGVPFALPRADLRRALLVAIPLTANNYLLNAAFGLIPVPLAVLIFYLWPAICTAASWAMGRERWQPRTVAGLVLAFGGVALALGVEFTEAQAEGVAYAAAASLTWSAAFLMMERFFAGRDTRPAIFCTTLIALAAFLALTLATQSVRMPQTPGGWTGLLATGFCYSFARIGLFAATARIGAVRAGFYMNFEPVASVLLAALILGQTLAPVQLAGAALVICELFLFRSGRASPSRRS